MKRILSFLFLLILPLLATAQAVVNPDVCGSLAKNITMTLISGNLHFPCAPSSIGGTGSFPRVAHHANGWVAWNYCTDGFSYSWQIAVVTDAALADTTLATDWISAQFADDKVKAVNDFATKHITLKLEDSTLTPIWCPEIHSIVAAKPGPVPYIVKPDPVANMRTVYFATMARNGTRILPPGGGIVPMKQADGTPTRCDCMNSRVIEGAQVYCHVTSQTLAVTACVKQ